MALKIQVTQNGFTYAEAYSKIGGYAHDAGSDFHLLRVWFYPSEASRQDHLNNRLLTIDFKVPLVDVETASYPDFYLYLKTLPEFNGAVDA